MRSTSLIGKLGIMVCEKEGTLPFPEKNYYRRLCLLGEKAGLIVFVFSPLHIDWETQSVPGYNYSKRLRNWQKNIFPLPDLIYDRCFFSSKQTSAQYRLHINKLRNNQKNFFLGHGLKGKWHVQKALMGAHDLHVYLPETECYQSINTVITWLKNKGEAFIKPQGGCQGRGVLHVARVEKHHYMIRGRDRKNRPIHTVFHHPFALLRWIDHFIGKQKYLVQQYLSLTSNTGEAFDIRSLVQKNSKGHWQLTGMAIRKGKPGSITSNLHGGGHAEQVVPFLEEQFGEEKALDIVACLEQLSMKIPMVLEQYHGRLVELGIDFGIDQTGRIWILEVNSKPGRSIFTQLNDSHAKKCSIINPIEYARYLLDRQLGG